MTEAQYDVLLSYHDWSVVVIVVVIVVVVVVVVVVVRPPGSDSWPSGLMFWCGRLDLILFFLSFFRRLISEVSGPIVSKLCHMFGGVCDL